jgi:pectin methylesterase-like acyl-CoA thioesterase
MFSHSIQRAILSIAIVVILLAVVDRLLAQPRSPATLVNCSGSIQACIDAANDGDTILIAAGRYTESLTLSKPVSLTGENRDTTIIHAIAGQRVLTVTGATISTTVVISGLTFTGGERVRRH